LVDDADYDHLTQWSWSLKSDGYVQRGTEIGGVKRCITMHRQILGLAYGDRRQGEHKNRNPLDNRRTNLRVAGRGQADNQQNKGLAINNKSGYRGVSRGKGRRNWRAQAGLAGVNHDLGYFDTPEQADAAVRTFRAQHMPFSDDAAPVK
jgi:hypothetical protein